MKVKLKTIAKILWVVVLIISLVVSVSAHSGKTDSRGGHKDNKNKSGLGSYHYHCGGYPAHLHTSGYCPYRDVFPSSVKLTADKKTLGIGETMSIAATVYPENSCNTNISWSCDNSSVLTISNGVITAKGYGSATITAETFNGKKTTFTVTVKEITAEKVTLSGVPNSTELFIGDSFKLTASITPNNVDNHSIKWSSSDPQVATVSSNGDIKLLSKGYVEITATASNGVNSKVKINVKEKLVELVEIEESSVDLFLGDKYSLNVSITPDDATYPELAWTSGASEIASVTKDGTITGLACGETVITATSNNGIKDTVFVRISEIKAETLKINGPDSGLLGETLTLLPIIIPENTTNKSVHWSVDNEAVAEITQDGQLTLKGIGVVNITAKQKDTIATLTIEVMPIPVENIVITPSHHDDISIDDTISFSAEVLPHNATYSNIHWSVDNPDFASIDENGTLTALKGGKVKVIATADDGYSASYELNITSPGDAVIGAAALAGIGIVSASLLNKKKKKKK